MLTFMVPYAAFPLEKYNVMTTQPTRTFRHWIRMFSAVLSCVFFFLAAVVPGKVLAQDLRINEVMASNATFYPDEDGSFEDWIELHNAGDEPVSLKGYGLSDDYDDPFMWTFPEYTIQPGEHLWIWASGKDRKDTPGEWHHGIKRRYYPGIPGTSVNDLINHPSFPDNPAVRYVVTNRFQAPTNIADHYGQHMFSWIMPPETGEYVFRIASDDNSRLYLSPDSIPENAEFIAGVPGWTNPREWDKYPQQTSEPVFLKAGKLYYLSALMKEHSGGDNLAVAWEWPDGTIEAPISALHCLIPETRFHTNFRIRAAGEEVLLTSPDGERVDEMQPTEIPTDVSYGRSPEDPDQWVYFSHPTPGAANTAAGYTGLSATPVLSPEGGVYQGPQEVSIESPDPDAQIYYTIDGSRPTASHGEPYRQPFTVSTTTYVRTVAIHPGSLPSEVVGYTYAIADDNIQGFHSNVPVMVIHSFDTPITTGFRTPAYMTLIDEHESSRVGLTGDPNFTGRIKINLRGSSSLSFPKKGFGFHIIEEDDSNRKVPLLDMPREHNWVLHGPYSDKSLIRNAFSYSIAEDAGYYSPGTRLIELFLHDGSSPLSEAHYHGVYVLTQRIKIAPGSVEIADTDLHHNNWPEVSGGYIFKIDRLNPGEEGFHTQRGNLFVFVRPNELNITSAQEAYLTGYLDSLETALFSDHFADPETGYAAYLDPGSFIDMHLITELTKEIDGFRLSTFFTKDRQGRVKSGPLWDFNLALGNANYLDGWDPTGWYYELISDYDYNRGWYTRMFEDPEFADRYARRYRMLRNTSFSRWNLMGNIRDYDEMLREPQQRNFERWDVLGEYVWPNWFIADTHEEEMEWMTDWLCRRIDWMDGALGEPYTMLHYWNFNDGQPLDPTYTIGGAELVVAGGSQSDVTTGTGQGFSGVNARNADRPGAHLRINNPVGADMVFRLPSSGYRELTFSYEARRSGSGANRHAISYSSNGEDFLPLDTVAITDVPQVVSICFADLPDANDNEAFAVRVTVFHDPVDDGGMEGNNRIDNVVLDGESLEGVIRPPRKILPSPGHVELIEGGDALEIDMTNHFKHPDDQQLYYVVHSPHSDKVAVSVMGQTIVAEPINRGGATVDVEVHDGVHPPLHMSLYLLIHPAPHALSESGFVFSNWHPDEPEGSFPEHMLFVQGDEDDAQLDTPLLYAYSIPDDDYADDEQENIGFPYRNESRTRINGLYDNGISFINTGRGRDLGAALLALDTRGVTGPSLTWTGSTLRTNSRVYHIRLQYRTGIGRPWRDWTDGDGNPVEYRREDEEGHSGTFENIPFPAEAFYQSYMQVRWLYYYTGVRLDDGSGARDMLALNKVEVDQGEPSGSQQMNLDTLFTYPVPATGAFVYLSATRTGQLYDLQGRSVAAVNNDRVVPISHLAHGVYLFRSTLGETVKIVVGR